LTVADAPVYAVPLAVDVLNVSDVQLPFCAWKVNVTVESAAPVALMVSVTDVPVVGEVNDPPLPFPLAGVDTVTVWPDPRLLTVLPHWSVTLTFAVNVPLAPMPVSVHVNEHGELSVPAETVTCVHARWDAEPVETVTVVEPVTVGEVVDAVSVFDPAANSVAVSVVVLAPLLNATDDAG
jgi:hypothetical protein